MNHYYKMYVLISVIFIAACKTSSTKSSDYVNVKMGTFIKVTEKENEVCSSLDRELNAEFQSDGESLTFTVCYHDGRNPFETYDFVTRDFRTLKEVVLFIERTESSSTLETYAELLYDVNGKRAFCPWGQINKFKKYGVPLKEISFDSKYSVNLSTFSELEKDFYIESPCFKVDGNIARRVKGFHVSDFLDK